MNTALGTLRWDLKARDLDRADLQISRISEHLGVIWDLICTGLCSECLALSLSLNSHNSPGK